MPHSAAPADATIHVVDDDAPARDSLLLLLSVHRRGARGFASATALLAAALTLEPGCVVSDIRMPEMDGLELQRRLAALRPDLPVILMTGFADVPLAVAAMRAGERDFLEKPVSAARLLRSSAAALAEAAAGPAGSPRPPPAEQIALRARLDLLTPRERAVMAEMLHGHPNKAIARILGISHRTVEIHRGRVMAKLAVDNLPDLLRLAQAAGGVRG